MRISREAIRILAETQGQIPKNFIEALREIKQRDEVIKARLLENEAVLSAKDALIRERDAQILEKDAILSEH